MKTKPWNDRRKTSSNDEVYDLITRVSGNSALGILGFLPCFLKRQIIPTKRIDTVKVVTSYLNEHYGGGFEKPSELETSGRPRIFSAIYHLDDAERRREITIRMNYRGTKVLSSFESFRG